MIQFCNEIYIHLALEKEIGKIVILKKHAERPSSILKLRLHLCMYLH